MWVNRQVYQELREALVAVTAVRDAQTANLAAVHTTLDWFRVRITQLEHERALLLQNYLGVTVPSLSIEKAPTSPTSIRPSYDPVPHFQDIGDDEAKRLGVEWNPETGEVVYSNTPETN